MSEGEGRINQQPKELGCSKLSRALKNDPLFQSLYSVVHWDDIVRSVLVFVIGTAIFYLVTFIEYTFFTLFSYFTLVALLAGFVATRLKGVEVLDYFRGNPNNAPNAEALTQTIIAFKSFVIDFFVWRRFLPTLFTFVFFLFLSQFAKLFTGTSLFYLSFFIGFIVPRAYGFKQAQIDQAISKTTAIIQDKWKIVESKLANTSIKLNLD